MHDVVCSSAIRNLPGNQYQALTEVISHDCDLVLFDEIEKGAQSLTKLLMGVLDTG